MTEAYPYIRPTNLQLDFAFSPEEIVTLPEPAQSRLLSILARYNRPLDDWNAEQAYAVCYRRNFPFATIYFDQDYPLGGHITSKRWDKYESPYRAYKDPPEDDYPNAGQWWFRTKERLRYSSQRCPIAAQAWELLKDKDPNSPWAVFVDALDPDFVTNASKLNDQLAELRKTDADLENTFPFNPEELQPVLEPELSPVIKGSTIWYTNPYISDRIEEIMKQYGKNVGELVVMLSGIFNKQRIQPWMTVFLEREHDLAAYFFDDCRFQAHELNCLTYTEDYFLTPQEFGHHYPFGMMFFVNKKKMHYCAGKSSLINTWWERVKELREDRGFMIAPSDDLSSYEELDIFAPAGI